MATVDVQKQEIELTKQDLGMVDMPPNNVITFFEGCDAAVVAPFLKERLDEIVSLNPWLAGWFDKKGYHYRDDDRSLVTWAANTRFEISKFKFEFPRARTYELYRARSRLYRSHILQENSSWKALAEIYIMHSFAPFSNLNFFVKNS